jgi:hypothetical protein
MPDELVDLTEWKKAEHKRLLRLREIFLDQERSEMNGELPCISRHLTNLDAVLVEDQLSDLNLRIKILARLAYVSARMYAEEPEPFIKHLVLLSIRRITDNS